MIAYVMTRPDSAARMFCGTTPDEVALAVKAEIQGDDGLAAEDIDSFRVSAVDVTQEEIDCMNEFDGW